MKDKKKIITKRTCWRCRRIAREFVPNPLDPERGDPYCHKHALELAESMVFYGFRCSSYRNLWALKRIMGITTEWINE